MAKVYLYEDGEGDLYLYREGARDVYCHIQTMVSYGATFQQDAAEIDRGVEPDETVERAPFDRLEELAPTIRLIAVWTDGKVTRVAAPGRDGELYLRAPSDFDSTDSSYF